MKKKLFTKLDSNISDVGSRINFQYKMKLNLTEKLLEYEESLEKTYNFMYFISKF